MPGNQRRTFLINRPFQVRFAFYVCSWLIALSFVYPLMISTITDYFVRVLALDPHGVNATRLLESRDELILVLVMMQIVFLVLIFVISIFMSHRVAGPLHKLNLYLNDAEAGNLSQRLAFRKTDYFQELAAAYNAMMDSIQSKQGGSVEALRKAIPQLENLSSRSTPEVRKELESVIDSLKKSQNTSPKN